jgi:hypothetical protein
MPEGEIIAGLWDPSAQDLVAITRPSSVRAGGTTLVRPEPPAEGADVVVVLERPDWVSTLDGQTPLLSIHGPDEPEPLAPDVVVATANRVFAFWYSVNGRYVALEADSDRVWMPTEEIPLRPHQVSSFRGALRTLPSLEIELALPPPLDEEAAALLVLDPASSEVVLFSDLGPGATKHRFDEAPVTILNVVAAVGQWRFEQLVDLSDGLDRAVLIQPIPIEVEGTVYRGKKPHPAIVRFHSGNRRTDSPIAVSADQDGKYTVTLFSAGQYAVEVSLSGVDGKPWSDRLLIREDTQLDIHISAASYRVRVIDSQTGQGIRGAKVICRNSWTDAQRVVSRVVETGPEGLADLFPMRQGALDLTATASGYLRQERTLEIYRDDESDHVVTLELEPAEDGSSLFLVLSDGRPAYDAEVSIQPGIDSPGPTWSGRCDSRGMITLPSLAEGQLVLVRHPGTSFLIRQWRTPNAGPTDVTWRLPSGSGQLQVRAVDSTGQPTPWANLAFQVEGYWLRGWTLSFLSRSSHSVTDSTGSWLSPSFPEVPIRVAAWSRGTDWASLGELESFAMRVDPPWGGRVIPVEVFK